MYTIRAESIHLTVEYSHMDRAYEEVYIPSFFEPNRIYFMEHSRIINNEHYIIGTWIIKLKKERQTPQIFTRS